MFRIRVGKVPARQEIVFDQRRIPFLPDAAAALIARWRRLGSSNAGSSAWWVAVTLARSTGSTTYLMPAALFPC